MDPCDTLVHLAIGPKPTTLMSVHRGVLTKSSAFFKSAFKPEWACPRLDPNTLSMPEDSPTALKLYISWRYTSTISIPLYHHRDPSVGDVIRAEETEKVYVALAHAYVFSKRILDDAYANAAVKRIIRAQMASYWGPGPQFAKILYAATTPGCKARRLFADIVGYAAWDDSACSVGWTTMMDGYDKEMLVDIMRSVMRSRGRNPKMRRPWEGDSSVYLKNEDVEEQ